MTIAWVLVVGGLGLNNAFAVPGIASEQECKALAEKMTAVTPMFLTPSTKCFSYQLAK